jgi:hypothetical protein
MALVRKIKPGEIMLLADGTSVENKHWSTVTLARLTREQTEQKLKEKSNKLNPTNGDNDDDKAKSK